jgi:ribosome biogenesis GTPase
MKLDSLGWNDQLDSLFAVYRDRRLIPARVVADGRDPVRVESERGPHAAMTAGHLDEGGEPGPPVIGDWLALDAGEDTATIRAILRRSSVLARRRPGAAERVQLLAANIDTVVLVDSLDRGPNRGRIERGVAVAYDGGATPVVVLSKADLCENIAAAEDEARLAAPFADVLAVSVVDGSGIDALGDLLTPGSTAVFLGPSGAGKSTLVNYLLGEERFDIGAVRDGDSKGRHTTTRRELVSLPTGTCLIDTPGIRELGLWLDVDAVEGAYPDLEAHAADCRFRDCRHEDEPGCAVRAAVEAGEIAPERLAGFLKLRREAEAHELRSSTHEVRAHERRFSRLIRNMKKVKGK